MPFPVMFETIVNLSLDQLDSTPGGVDIEGTRRNA
jgi:hypothetical protein